MGMRLSLGMGRHRAGLLPHRISSHQIVRKNYLHRMTKKADLIACRNTPSPGDYLKGTDVLIEANSLGKRFA